MPQYTLRDCRGRSNRLHFVIISTDTCNVQYKCFLPHDKSPLLQPTPLLSAIVREFFILVFLKQTGMRDLGTSVTNSILGTLHHDLVFEIVNISCK
jgi:hypothetical protein